MFIFAVLLVIIGILATVITILSLPFLDIVLCAFLISALACLFK